MLPLLLVLGATGALLEIKRLVNKPPQDGDAIRLKQSEERLRRVLQASHIDDDIVLARTFSQTFLLLQTSLWTSEDHSSSCHIQRLCCTREKPGKVLVCHMPIALSTNCTVFNFCWIEKLKRPFNQASCLAWRSSQMCLSQSPFGNVVNQLRLQGLKDLRRWNMGQVFAGFKLSAIICQAQSPRTPSMNSG